MSFSMRLVGLICGLCGLGSMANAQITESRQAVVATPAFQITTPATLTPAELQGEKGRLQLENLTSNPIDLTITRELRIDNVKDSGTASQTKTVKLEPRLPVTTEPLNGKLAEAAVKAVKMNYPVTARAKAVTIVVTTLLNGKPNLEKTILVDFPHASTAIAQVAELKVRRTGTTLQNAFLPLATASVMACSAQPETLGWVQGSEGVIKVLGQPGHCDTATGLTSQAVDQLQLQFLSAGLSNIPQQAQSPKVGTRMLQFLSADSGDIPAGEYTGNLTLGVAGDDKAKLKLSLQSTWPWWSAGLCILLGVVTGFLYRWFSGFWADIWRACGEVGQAKKAALDVANGLNKSTTKPTYQGYRGADEAYAQPFSNLVQTEAEDLKKLLKKEWGLTRDPAVAEQVSKRLAALKQLPEEYTKWVKALDTLAATDQMPENLLGQKIESLLGTTRPLEVTTLPAQRVLAETYLGLHPVWKNFEEKYKELSKGVLNVKCAYAARLAADLAGVNADLALQIIRDIRDTEAALGQARRQLDTVEPSLESAKDIRSSLESAATSLSGAQAMIDILHHIAVQQKLSAGENKQPPLPLRQVPLPEAVHLATLEVSHYRLMLGSLNFALAIVSLLLALVFGLNEVYWGKVFGWPQAALTAFAWGLGTKIGVDNIFTALSRLFNTPIRPAATT